VNYWTTVNRLREPSERHLSWSKQGLFNIIRTTLQSCFTIDYQLCRINFSENLLITSFNQIVHIFFELLFNKDSLMILVIDSFILLGLEYPHLV
jgi:hypothetical protein